ncbi:MAG: hypothetical protein R6U51_06090 [Anaerolineales bacterium]
MVNETPPTVPDNPMESKHIKDAVAAIKKGNRKKARKRLLAALKENPEDLQAWIWSVEVAENEKEKRTILKRILALDPTHRAARELLGRMEDSSSELEREPHGMEEVEESGGDTSSQNEPFRPLNMLLAPLKLIPSVPLSCGLLLLLGAMIAGVFIFLRSNTSFLGLTGVDFDQLQSSNAYQDVSLEGDYWKVRYEGGGKSTYGGTVRHVGPIRNADYKLLTHDVLVTSGDFADPEAVKTSVFNHKFSWHADGLQRPQGKINLLHTMPNSEAVHQQLLDIQKWDEVQITGWEIYAIYAFDEGGDEKGYWADTGCNTLLVDSVSINSSEDNMK